jgi:hypothetical protein
VIHLVKCEDCKNVGMKTTSWAGIAIVGFILIFADIAIFWNLPSNTTSGTAFNESLTLMVIGIIMIFVGVFGRSRIFYCKESEYPLVHSREGFEKKIVIGDKVYDLVDYSKERQCEKFLREVREWHPQKQQ